MTELTFVAWHRPALPIGLYRVHVGQRLQSPADDTHEATDLAFGDLAQPGPGKPGKPRKPGQATDAATLVFATQGPRTSLPSGAIVGRFPPDGTVGHEAGVLPHIQLADSTLPWARAGGPPGRASTGTTGDPPWLALIVIAGEELKSIETVTRTAAELQLPVEPGHPPNEAATLLRLPSTLAAQVLPTLAELAWLSHVRETTDPPSLTAVVVANRAVVAGAHNQVHLVSVEGVDLDSLAAPGEEPSPTVELITLASWAFESVDDGNGFRDLALALAHNRGPLWAETGDPAADAQLRRGVVPLRSGSGAAFYRGPLAPTPDDPVAQLIRRAFRRRLPVRAEELIVYDEQLAAPDVTYAVAWELGRSLAIANADDTVALADHRRAVRHADQARGQLHGIADHHQRAPDPPPAVLAWFDALASLELVPPRYLLADAERLVPLTVASWSEHGSPRTASGRLAWFTVDPIWVALLSYGALSVSQPAAPTRDEVGPPNRPQRGFVLRSPLVRWADLEITVWPAGLDAVDGVQPLVHRTRELAPDLMVVLFDQSSGDTTVEIGRHPTGVHLGLGDTTPSSGARLDVGALARSLGASTSADFALGLVDPTPRIRFGLAEGIS